MSVGDGPIERYKRSWPILLLFLFALPSSVGAYDYFKLTNVKRLDKDIYRADGKIIIGTKYCYHYAYGEDAILKWDMEGSTENKLIWENDDTPCQVAKLTRL